MLLLAVVGVVWLAPQGIPLAGSSQAPVGHHGWSLLDAAATPMTLTHTLDLVAPVTVNLADLPPSTPYDQWHHQGNIGPNEVELRTIEAWEQLWAEAANLPVSDQVAWVGDAAAFQPTTILTGFATLDFSQCCGGGSLTPPDPMMAVGTHHLLVAVNQAFAIYDKNGAFLLGPITLSALFSPLGAGNSCNVAPFDPQVLYDEATGRFLLTADGNGTALCLAVSQSGNPTGAWHVWKFDTGPGFFDFPQAGIGRNELFVGANNYNAPGGVGQIYAIRKSPLYAGLPVSATVRTLNPTLINPSPTPLHLHGFNQGTWPSSGPHYFLAHHYDNHIYTLYAWNDPFGVNTLTTVATFDLTATSGVAVGTPLIMPQKDGNYIGGRPGQGLIDARQWDLEYRNGYLWTTMHVSCNPGGGSVNCIRWAKIEPTTGSIVQSGVLGSPGVYRAYPDLMVDHQNNLALVYARLTASSYPGAYFTCRGSHDQPGVPWLEAPVKQGEVVYQSYDLPPYRWGDYLTLTIDPDGVTFWAIGQYSKNIATVSRWGTYVAAFTYADCPYVTEAVYLPLIIR